MIQIAIVEDITRIAEALKAKILLSPDFKLKCIAPNGAEIIKLLERDHNVDVIIMDINMPEMNGIEATNEDDVVDYIQNEIEVSYSGDGDYHVEDIQVQGVAVDH